MKTNQFFWKDDNLLDHASENLQKINVTKDGNVCREIIVEVGARAPLWHCYWKNLHLIPGIYVRTSKERSCRKVCI